MQNKLIVKKINKKYFLRTGKCFFNCQLGKRGPILSSKKVEGDKATPIGKWKLNTIYFRGDKILRPRIRKSNKLKLHKLTKNCSWCDDINSHFYNKYIQIKNNVFYNNMSYEKLWREDAAYDIFITLDYNTKPIIRKKGSAIFIHCSFEDKRSTSGCIALSKKNIIKLVKNIKKNTFIII